MKKIIIISIVAIVIIGVFIVISKKGKDIKLYSYNGNSEAIAYPPDKYLDDLEVGEKLRWEDKVFQKTNENTWLLV